MSSLAVGNDLTVPQWMNRAAKDTRELILARRNLIRISESDDADEEKYHAVRARIVDITHPYGIFLGMAPPQCIFLLLPNKDSNEPTGKFWSVPR